MKENKTKRPVQRYDVLMHLITHKKPLDYHTAYTKYHTNQVRTVVCKLRKEGIKISSINKIVRTPYGKMIIKLKIMIINLKLKIIKIIKKIVGC